MLRIAITFDALYSETFEDMSVVIMTLAMVWETIEFKDADLWTNCGYIQRFFPNTLYKCKYSLCFIGIGTFLAQSFLRWLRDISAIGYSFCCFSYTIWIFLHEILGQM